VHKPTLVAADLEVKSSAGDDESKLTAASVPAGAKELDFKDIQQTIAAAEPRFAPCFEAALEPFEVDRNLRPQILAKLLIGTDGAVIARRVSGPSVLMKRGLGSCLLPVLSTLRFPRSGAQARIEVPLRFRPE
jgi:hypothetical protein